MRHLLKARDLDREQIRHLIRQASSRFLMTMVRGMDRINLRDKVVVAIVDQPSTRTVLSLQNACIRIGATLHVTSMAAGAVAKGESVEDSARAMSLLCDCIWVRHPDTNMAERVASTSLVPVVNAGCGNGEHPTQALGDLVTIAQRTALDDLHQLKICLAGDVWNSRVQHSLLEMLHSLQCSVELTGYEMPIYDHIERADVLHVSRRQDGTPPDWTITPELMQRAKRSMILMSPGPRREEISPKVDSDPRFVMDEQVDWGVWAKVAVLLDLLDPTDLR